MLLVAARDLPDSNFSETVVLLLDYDERGALGLIINRPIDMAPAELLPDVRGLHDYRGTVYVGGPVLMTRMFVLFRSSRTPPDAKHIFDDVYMSASRTVLENMSGPLPDSSALRLYAGYAGWGAGQLNSEIARGDWHLIPADTDLVFSEEPDGVWEKLLPRRRSIVAAL